MATDQEQLGMYPEAHGPMVPLTEFDPIVRTSTIEAPLPPVSLVELAMTISEIDDARGLVASSFADTVASVVTDTVPPAPTPTDPMDTIINKDKKESKKAPVFKPRPARLEDIPELVDIDIRAFDAVYRNYDMTREELRADLEQKFRGRFDIVGADWIQVLESESGKLAGFMMCCPTNKSPQDFESWEKTTDNGTLETTYDPKGKNLYVVTMTMTPEGSKHNGQDILYVNQLGKMTEQGIGRAFFESRIPGFRAWANLQAKKRGTNISVMSDEDRLAYAEEYVGLTKVLHGKEVRYDKLLRIYDDFGAEFIKVAADAYQDVPSMNFGVVCVIKNPLPEFMQNSPILSKLGGKAIRFLSKHRKLMDKVF